MNLNAYKGLRDWWMQRVSTLFIMLYFLAFMGIWLSQPANFEEWRSLLLHPAMRILLIAAVSSITIHAILGIWVVLTDYVKPKMIQTPLLVLTHTGFLLMNVFVLYWMWSF